MKVDRDFIEKTVHSVMNEYVNEYKSGYEAARRGDEKYWGWAQKLADKQARVVMNRIDRYAQSVAEERALEARIDMAQEQLDWECLAGYQDQEVHIRVAQNSLQRLQSQRQNQMEGKDD